MAYPSELGLIQSKFQFGLVFGPWASLEFLCIVSIQIIRMTCELLLPKTIVLNFEWHVHIFMFLWVQY